MGFGKSSPNTKALCIDESLILLNNSIVVKQDLGLDSSLSSPCYQFGQQQMHCLILQVYISPSSFCLADCSSSTTITHNPHKWRSYSYVLRPATSSMSFQSGHSSSHQEEEGQPSPSSGMTPASFHLFCDLPPELQIIVWEWAFWTSPRRLACLRIRDTPSARLAHQVLNLNNLQASIGWPLANPLYLEETDHVARLLVTAPLSQTVVQPLVRETMRTPWLRRLGLTEYHINPHTDIVFFGSDLNLLADRRIVLAASLVLGSAFPNIMVPAESFLNLGGALLGGAYNPVDTALTIVRAADPVWHELFRPGPNALPRPALPKNIYFLLGPLPSTDLCGHGRGCIHLEHLEVFDPSGPEAWHSALQASFDLENSSPFLETLSNVHDIRMFWDNVENVSDFTGEIPRIIFVRFST